MVSRYGDLWTFLNSGTIQKDVRESGITKGVAEEDLKAEIGRWLKRAQNRGESLRISFGRLDPNKLAAFRTSQPIRLTA